MKVFDRPLGIVLRTGFSARVWKGSMNIGLTASGQRGHS